MFSGNQETVTRKDRTMIKKRDAIVVFKNNPSREFAAGDFAKETG
jgi:hypothetical protein